MKINKHKNCTLIVITIIVLTTAFHACARITPADTSFKDITGAYNLKMPPLQNDLDIQDFEVAIINLDSIGKKNINWNNNVSPFIIWNYADKKISEMEFEEALLNCTQSSDSIVSLIGKTIKQKPYCRQNVGGDGVMGFSIYETNYVSFTRDHKLIIIAFVIRWNKCGIFEDVSKCEEAENRKGIKIDSFIDTMVKKISFYQINNK